MEKVISLLSSSPVALPKKLASRKRGSLESSHALSSDNLDEYEDCLNNSASKKQRRNSAINQIAPTSKLITPSKSFNLILSDISDFDNTPGVNALKSRTALLQTPTYDAWNIGLDDPIICSSSTPNDAKEEAVARTRQSELIIIDDDDDDDDILDIPDNDGDSNDDDVSEFPQLPVTKSFLSDRASRLLEQIRSRNAERTASRTVPKNKKGKQDVDISLENDLIPPGPARRPTSSHAEKAAKSIQRQAAKARRDKEKMEEKEERRRKKELKEKQKQIAADIEQANKSKTDKTISTVEMIVDMSSTFKDTSIGTQVEEHLRQLNVQMNFTSTKVPDIVSWSRKVTAKYNAEAGHWEPCTLEIKAEPHILCFLTSERFVELATAPSDAVTVQSHVKQLSAAYPNRKPIYMIEGLAAWIRKNKNSRNRSYQAAVLQQIDANQDNQIEPSTTKSKRKKAAKKPDLPGIVDEDVIEDALLELQVRHSCLVQHTVTASESAEWIKVLTENISTIPYRRELMNSHNASFCMEIGQVKSGDDAGDVYVKMLQEVTRITAPIAYGVTNRYTTVGKLVKALDSGGHLLLEDIKKCANKNGALTDARLGPAISRRLFNIFTSLDPAMLTST